MHTACVRRLVLIESPLSCSKIVCRVPNLDKSVSSDNEETKDKSQRRNVKVNCQLGLTKVVVEGPVSAFFSVAIFGYLIEIEVD